MFVDASAVVAIMCDEPDGPDLLMRLAATSDPVVSPVVFYESTLGIARKKSCDLATAEAYVDLFIRETGAALVQVDDRIGRLALEAFARFGKGRHPAGLNMGDCFAYACAKAQGARLLFKGEDFSLTDIEAA